MKTPARRIGEAGVGILVLAFAVAWLSGWCGPRVAGIDRSREADPGSESERVAVVEQISLPMVEEASGTIAAAKHAVVSSKYLARIEEVRVRAGSQVAEGDVLIVLDSRDLQARVEAAREELQAARARLDLARTEQERTERLFAGQVANRQQLDRARAELSVAKAGVERAAQQLRDTEVALSHSEIRSPVNGRVVDRLAEPGDTAVPGTPLLRIYDPSLLRLEAPIREALATRLEPGQELRVHIPSLNQRLGGVIDEIVPQAEPGARTFLVKVRLPDVSGLYAGMFGRVAVPAGTQTLLRVEAAAIQRVGQLEYVLVVDPEGGAQRRMITSAPLGDGAYCEALSGLEAGERVLVPEEADSSEESTPSRVRGSVLR